MNAMGNECGAPPMLNHYCTYFDRNFLVQGCALAASLRENDPASVLWVLCLDDFTFSYLRQAALPRVRAVELADLERADEELRVVKDGRQKVEYYFTLSPCWPRYLLREVPGIDRITYVDADMYFFGSPNPIFAEMDTASILVTEHRYPSYLRHHLRCGKFNVGLLSFRNDPIGRDCLDEWRTRCLAWCFDRAEEGKYGDQKYLDEWPDRYGAGLCVSRRLGANLAPWNWPQYRFSVSGDRILVDGQPLELFHFARFAPVCGSHVLQSGQLEYGVMPWGLRQRIYGRYWRALKAAEEEIAKLRPGFGFKSAHSRGWHGFWRALVPRLVFGSDWIRLGPLLISGRFGLGRYSGRVLAALRSRAKMTAQSRAGETIVEPVSSLVPPPASK